MLKKALEKKFEVRAWDLYLTKYAWMTEEDFISFEEFYKPQQPVDTKSEDEILIEVKQILDTFKGGV